MISFARNFVWHSRLLDLGSWRSQVSKWHWPIPANHPRYPKEEGETKPLRQDFTTATHLGRTRQ